MIIFLYIIILIHTIIICDVVCQTSSYYLDDDDDDSESRNYYYDIRLSNNEKYIINVKDVIASSSLSSSSSSSSSSSGSGSSSSSTSSSSSRSRSFSSIERNRHTDSLINSNLDDKSYHKIVTKDDHLDDDDVISTSVSEYVVKSFFAGLQVRPKLGM
jgi:hypothetical protein